LLVGVDILNDQWNEFTITGVDDGHIHISIPGNASVNRLALNLDEVRKMLESGQKFEKIKDITSFFGKTFATMNMYFFSSSCFAFAFETVLFFALIAL